MILKLNLRNVATIVSCLTVLAMFVTCDKNNGNGSGNNRNNGGSSNDSQIIGTWVTTHTLSHYYEFCKDATFEHRHSFNSNIIVTVEGKYKTSNGKIFMTNLYCYEFNHQSSTYGEKKKMGR
jgi:hypothetical protein